MQSDAVVSPRVVETLLTILGVRVGVFVWPFRLFVCVYVSVPVCHLSLCVGRFFPLRFYFPLGSSPVETFVIISGWSSSARQPALSCSFDVPKAPYGRWKKTPHGNPSRFSNVDYSTMKGVNANIKPRLYDRQALDDVVPCFERVSFIFDEIVPVPLNASFHFRRDSSIICEPLFSLSTGWFHDLQHISFLRWFHDFNADEANHPPDTVPTLFLTAVQGNLDLENRSKGPPVWYPVRPTVSSHLPSPSFPPETAPKYLLVTLVSGRNGDALS